MSYERRQQTNRLEGEVVERFLAWIESVDEEPVIKDERPEDENNPQSELSLYFPDSAWPSKTE